MKVDRFVRVNALLQQELARLFESLVAPELAFMVTVTGVKVAPNLREAMVYISVYGSDSDAELALQVLGKKRVQLQAGLANKVVLKYTPVLRFRLDQTAERADRVMAILNELDADNKNPSQE